MSDQEQVVHRAGIGDYDLHGSEAQAFEGRNVPADIVD